MCQKKNIRQHVLNSNAIMDSSNNVNTDLTTNANTNSNNNVDMDSNNNPNTNSNDNVNIVYEVTALSFLKRCLVRACTQCSRTLQYMPIALNDT